jgi:hypothetical protein
MRVLESVNTLVSMENASTEYASTENVDTKVLNIASTENACSDNAGTIEKHGKCEYGIYEY